MAGRRDSGDTTGGHYLQSIEVPAGAQRSHNIVATYGGDATNGSSNNPPLAQSVNSAGPINVALDSDGAVASALSTYVAAGYQPGVTSRTRLRDFRARESANAN